MALLKKKTAPVAPRRKPTHAERLDVALTRKASAESLVAAGATALSSVAAEIDGVAKSAFEEAARLSELGNQATSAAGQAEQRSVAANSLLS